MIKRELTEIIKQKFFKNKAIIITGPRQVGKTTLVKALVEDAGEAIIWFNGDEPKIPQLFSEISSAEMTQLFGKNKIVVIDEAQQIDNIGTVLKLIVDNIPEVQLIATGSSSFDLTNKLSEPLTGRKFEYLLYPISYNELVNEHGKLKEKQELNLRLIYGSYPEIITEFTDASETLAWLSDSYLYKDLLKLEFIKKPSLLVKLLQALAWQLGSEVSYNEVARTIGSDPKTVEKYIDLLEKTFVVFRLPAFSRNIRTELKKSRKIYFYDNGIRNAIIGNFNRIEMRNDVGALWENYLISERIKVLEYKRIRANIFFWRTTQQQEVDYVEERDGLLNAYEFKYNPKKRSSLSKTFQSAYPEHIFKVINSKNYSEFLI
ncbi:MAG: ATP-binding protein [Bacteroidota bacterium]|nr:ATP-binding protein [Bacteroidota bacterium]